MSATFSPDYLEQQYNNRAAVPQHPQIIANWLQRSAEVRASRRCELDLEYGPGYLEKLDLFFPDGPSQALLMFVHGGYWRAMDKNDFSFLVPSFAQRGVTVAVVNYSLAPQVRIDDIVAQMRHAVTWLTHHAHRYGADANKLFIAGHSAGGHLVAMLAATHWPSFSTTLPANLIKGAIAISGLYDLAPMRQISLNQEIKLDEYAVERLSPALVQPPVPVPMIVAVGGDESDEFKRQNQLLIERWRLCPMENIPLPGTNHFTVVEQLGLADSPLHQAALRMMQIQSR